MPPFKVFKRSGSSKCSYQYFNKCIFVLLNLRLQLFCEIIEKEIIIIIKKSKVKYSVTLFNFLLIQIGNDKVGKIYKSL